MCVCVVIVHWHCSAQLSMFNMEKRYRNKIIIIIIIIPVMYGEVKAQVLADLRKVEQMSILQAVKCKLVKS